MLYGGAHVNIKKYIENNGVDLKYTLSFRYNVNACFDDLGFANCYKKIDGGYTYVGGIDPKYFNSGLGVKGDVAMLSYVFNRHPGIILTTGVYKYNVRSLKLTKAVGFKQIGETDNAIIFKMIKDDFNNDFSNKILNTINIEY